MRIIFIGLLVVLSYTCTRQVPLSAQEPEATPRAPPRSPGEIMGRVVAAETGAPLAAAAVVVQRDSGARPVAGVLTSADGGFRMGPLPSGRYLLRATRIGYAPSPWLAVAVTDSAVEHAAIALTPAPVALRGLEAEAVRAPVTTVDGRLVYPAAGLAAASAGSVTDLLREIPELEVDGRGGISLRGSTGVAIQVNGRPVAMRGDALRTYLRQLPAERVDRIEVALTPSAAADPEGSAGIVDIVLKKGVEPRASGRLSAFEGLRSRGAYGSVGRQLGRLQLRANASASENTTTSHLHDVRQNLLARPVTVLDQAGGSDDRTRSGTADLAAELRIGQATTLFTSLDGSAWTYRGDGRMLYALTDSQLVALERYHRDGSGRSRQAHGDVVLGARHSFRPQRHELSLELRAACGADTVYSRYFVQPADASGLATGDVDETRLNDSDGDDRLLSAQLDYLRTIGGSGRLQAGYRWVDRRSSAQNALQVLVPAMAAQTAPTDGGYDYRERFGSLYATLQGQLGRTTLEAGARLEEAATRFRVRSSGGDFDHYYRNVYPTGSVTFDLGGGRQARLAYSRRVQRPDASLLNPDVPELDALNYTVGNPHLRPEYTHLLSAEAVWSGSRGSLRLSPYFRRTVEDWDQLKTVDSLGVATVTWVNVAHADAYGAALTGTLAGVGRVSGFASVGAFREVQDVGGGTAGTNGSALRFTGNVNASVRPSRTLTVQGSLLYSPPRRIPQGRISHTVMSTLALRQRVSDRIQLSLSATDPLGLWHYSFETRDGSHVQTSRDDYDVRNAVLVLHYTFGPASRRPDLDTPTSPEQQLELRIH